MTARRDILDNPASLKSPFFGSLVMHAVVLSLLVYLSIAQGHRGEQWGSPTGGGGAVGIQAVKGIPLPAQTGPANPVANDTESNVPLPPKNAKKAAPKLSEEGIPIKARKAPKRMHERVAENQKFRPDVWHADNKLSSTAGGALSNPMFGGLAGSGGVGIGSAAFGNRFGYYAELLQRRIAEKWNTAGLPQSATPAVVGFDILRSGQTKNIRVLQTSGNRTLDDTALRAIYEASPFDTLPAAYQGSQVDIEIWFYVKR
jgi:protein TonB